MDDQGANGRNGDGSNAGRQHSPDRRKIGAAWRWFGSDRSGVTSFPPAPRLGFSVGIVGHRADRIVDHAQVCARLDQALKAIDAALDAAARNHLYKAGREPLSLVSALAEGSDRMAAKAALDLGMVLEVVLPFTPAEYERDFPEAASRSEFHELMGRASSIVVLDGDQVDRSRGYEAAGMTMLDNCDLLIAVWDGGPGRGRGGTREVLGEAARRAMPVIVIPPDGASIVMRGAPHAGPMRFEDVPENPIDSLPETIVSIVGTHSDPSQEADWRRLAKMPPNPIIHGAYPLLLKLAGVGRKRSRKGASQPVEAPPQGALAVAFAWWDGAAIRAAQAFRSAVIVNFALAALAVVLAATSVLAGDWKPLFVLVEIVTILLLTVNAMRAERLRWHERWLESRQVAELLRVGTMLRSVGVGRGISRPGDGGSNGWYASAISRSCPLETVDLSDPAKAAAPLLTEVRDQASWNAATSHRMHLAAHRIERFGEVLFGLVLVAAIGWLILNVFNHHAAHDLRYPLTALTAGLPAIATASYGIRVILDFEGNSNRSHQIAIGLNALVEAWERGPATSAALQEFASRSAEIMLGDVAAWRLLAEGRRLTIPG
jgi:Protein of unknown function (DUF4231)